MTVVVMLRWQCTRFVAQRAPGLLPTWNGRSNGAWLSYLKAIWPEWNEKQESINSLGVQFAPWAEALKRTNHVGSGHWKMNCERPGLLWPALAWHSATARRDVSMSESEIQVSSHHICIFASSHPLPLSKSRSAWTVENTASPLSTFKPSVTYYLPTTAPRTQAYRLTSITY